MPQDEPVPRFSIKDLMVATIIVSIGMLMATRSSKSLVHPDEHFTNADFFFQIVFYLTGSGLAGAGLLSLLERPFIGGCVGVILGYVVLKTSS